MEQKEKIESLKNKAIDREKSESEELNKALAGKKTMTTFFSSKTKEEEVAGFEKAIANVIHSLISFTRIGPKRC